MLYEVITNVALDDGDTEKATLIALKVNYDKYQS